MTPNRFAQARELFLAALDLPPVQRTELLARRREIDPQLADWVDRMLRASDERSPFLIDESIAADLTEAIGQAVAAARDPATACSPRVAVDDHHILRELGSGSYATVYLAEQLRPVRRRVALKVPHLHLRNPEVLRRFETERQTLAGFQHPGIAQLLGAGQTADGRPFFTLEFVEGPTILDWARDARATAAEKLRGICQLCDAVQHAHECGVLHRDLKPGNVLVSADRIKVIDFGVAKSTPTDPLHTHPPTIDGRLIGTLAYMSPEQIEGRASVRSDIYAIGVIAYELLTGGPPIDVGSLPLPAAIEAVKTAQPRPPSSFNRFLPPDVDTVILRALAKDPHERYSSAASLAEDILCCLSFKPIQARRESSMYVLRRFVRRNRIAVCAAAVTLAVMLAAGIATSRAVIRADREHRQRQQVLGEVLDSQSRFASEVLPRLAHVRGTADARRILVGEFVKISHILHEAGLRDERLLTVQAELLTAGSGFEYDDGDMAGAMEHRLRAVEAREALLELRPADAAEKKRLAINVVLVGDIRKETGDRAGAERDYVRALEIQSSLAKADPENVGLLEDLSFSHGRLADLALYRGSCDAAADRLSRMARTNAELLRLAPDLPATWDAHQFAASLRLFRADRCGQAPEIEAGGADRLFWLEKLTRAHPENTSYARDYVATLIGAGRTLRLADDCDGAERSVLLAAARLSDVRLRELPNRLFFAMRVRQAVERSLIELERGDAASARATRALALALIDEHPAAVSGGSAAWGTLHSAAGELVDSGHAADAVHWLDLLIAELGERISADDEFFLSAWSAALQARLDLATPPRPLLEALPPLPGGR